MFSAPRGTQEGLSVLAPAVFQVVSIQNNRSKIIIIIIALSLRHILGDLSWDPTPTCTPGHRHSKCNSSQQLRVDNSYIFLIFYLFIHERHREREAETQAEVEAGSTQGTRCRTRSQVPRITPWANSGAKPLSHPGCPAVLFL